MSKNSQYGRWRRAAMQAVMWLVFAATLALAGFVSHSRTADLKVELGESVRFDALIVRLPKGWSTYSTPGLQVRALVAEEPEVHRRGRQLFITQERQGKRGAESYLESMLNVPGEVRAERFDFLGNRGALIAWRGVPRGMWVEEDKVERLSDPGLYACTVLRNGLTVTVQVRGEGAFGPSNRRLLRQVADGMTPADGANRTTP